MLAFIEKLIVPLPDWISLILGHYRKIPRLSYSFVQILGWAGKFCFFSFINFSEQCCHSERTWSKLGKKIKIKYFGEGDKNQVKRD